MKYFNLILILFSFSNSSFGQLSNNDIAWHSNVKEIQFIIDKYNIEKVEFDSLGRKILEIEYHPLQTPYDEIGHGYDSTIYIYDDSSKISKEYFTWYGQVFLEEVIKTYNFNNYDSIISFDKNDSILSTQLRFWIKTDSIIGHFNDKGFAIDTFLYHLNGKKIKTQEVIWNKRNGERIYYTSKIEYDDNGEIIQKTELLFDTVTMYKYDKNGHLKLIISKWKNKKGYKKEKIDVKYKYFNKTSG